MDYPGSLRILIAGDPYGDMLALSALLELDGHTLIGRVSTGYQAVMVARQQKPDLILVDVDAIGLDEIEERQITALQRVCPIVLLGTSPQLAPLDCDRLKDCVYLRKPVQQQQVEQTINQILTGSLGIPDWLRTSVFAQETLTVRWNIRRAIAYVADRDCCSQTEAMERIHQEARAKRARLTDVASAIVLGETVPYCHDAPV